MSRGAPRDPQASLVLVPRALLGSSAAILVVAAVVNSAGPGRLGARGGVVDGGGLGRRSRRSLATLVRGAGPRRARRRAGRDRPPTWCARLQKTIVFFGVLESAVVFAAVALIVSPPRLAARGGALPARRDGAQPAVAPELGAWPKLAELASDPRCAGSLARRRPRSRSRRRPATRGRRRRRSQAAEQALAAAPEIEAIRARGVRGRLGDPPRRPRELRRRPLHRRAAGGPGAAGPDRRRGGRTPRSGRSSRPPRGAPSSRRAAGAARRARGAARAARGRDADLERAARAAQAELAALAPGLGRGDAAPSAATSRRRSRPERTSRPAPKAAGGPLGLKPTPSASADCAATASPTAACRRLPARRGSPAIIERPGAARGAEHEQGSEERGRGGARRARRRDRDGVGLRAVRDPGEPDPGAARPGREAA